MTATAGTRLSEQIRSAKQRAAEAAALDGDLIESLNKADRYNEQDLPPLSQPKQISSDVLLSRAVKRQISHINSVYEKTGRTPQEHADRHWIWKLERDEAERRIQQKGASQEELEDTYMAGALQDILDNYLYVEWGLQLLSGGPFRTYGSYCNAVAMKAVIHAFAFLPAVQRELTELLVGRGLQVPTHDDAVRYMHKYHFTDVDAMVKERRDGTQALFNMLSPDPDVPADEQFARMIDDVPGCFQAGELLLERYSNNVRASREAAKKNKERTMDSPLPDDPQEGVALSRNLAESPEHVRLEQAILASQDRQRNYKDVAKQYGIGQTKFLAELQRRGLSQRKRGKGRVKGPKVELETERYTGARPRVR